MQLQTLVNKALTYSLIISLVFYIVFFYSKLNHLGLFSTVSILLALALIISAALIIVKSLIYIFSN